MTDRIRKDYQSIFNEATRLANKEATKKEIDKFKPYIHKFEQRINFLEANGRIREAKIFDNAVRCMLEDGNSAYMRALKQARSIPVTIDEFVENPEFLGERIDVWPRLREVLREVKPDLMVGERPILEILNSSTIGTGKSEVGKLSMLYDIYFLTCFKHPQLLFNSLNTVTPLTFCLQSVKDTITRRVLYEPLRNMFEQMPYIQKYVNYNRDKQSSLEINNKSIIVTPLVASPEGFIGMATIGGHIDEANFMEVIEESRKVSAKGGGGGLYDQAEATYNMLSRRRKSRFLSDGLNPGTIYVSSSVNYEDDFLSRRINQVEELREKSPEKASHIKVYRFCQWDVKPSGFSGDTLPFLIGTNDYAPALLPDDPKEGKDYPVGGQVEAIPVEFEEEFRKDPENSQRDLLNIASSAIQRFIGRTDKIINAVEMAEEYGLHSFLFNDNIELSNDQFLEIDESLLPDDLDTPRFVHIDLSRVSDRVGIAMVKILGHTAMSKPNGIVEVLPTYAVEMAASIQPDKVHRVDIADIRSWVVQLRNHYGFNIKAVTYDGFDSQESIQLLRKTGIRAYVQSMDKTTEPYEQFRDALYHNRVLMINNSLAKTELATLEKIQKGGKMKIDHPIKGSKDIADAIVGACRAAYMDRTNRSKTTMAGKGIVDGRARIDRGVIKRR